MVDLDPQGSATSSFGVSRAEAEPSTADCCGDREAAGRPGTSPVEGIHLLPLRSRLAGADLALARKQEPEKLLKKALSPCAGATT